jgi:diketogulonate reductase-like aldo/keto reductase
MRITGPGIEPRDIGETRRVVLRAVELGVTFIDTAHSYGPFDREGEPGVDELAERASICACAEAFAPRHLPGLIVLHVVHDRV